MEDVKMIRYLSCAECAKLFDTLDKKGKAELKAERSKLERCKGCRRVNNK